MNTNENTKQDASKLSVRETFHVEGGVVDLEHTAQLDIDEAFDRRDCLTMTLDIVWNGAGKAPSLLDIVNAMNEVLEGGANEA